MPHIKINENKCLGHSKHHQCCNRQVNRCCKQPLPKHESNSHFNQFVHSKSVPKPLAQSKLPKNDHQTNRNPAPKQLPSTRPSLKKVGLSLPPPYAFWPRKPLANPMDTTKLMAKQASRLAFQPKMPISRVLMSRQQQQIAVG